jgi:hypothetical protein
MTWFAFGFAAGNGTVHANDKAQQARRNNGSRPVRYEPHGSTFGGYGFWTHSAAPSAQPAHLNSASLAAPVGARAALLTWLAQAARKLLRVRGA